MYKKYIVFILLASLFLTGCWDKIEIEERAQVAALGIDKYEDSSEAEGEEIFQEGIKRKFTFTFAFPKMSLDEVEDIVVRTVGETFYSASRILVNRTNQQMFLGHLRTVILGLEVTKDPKLFREILDGIETNELISRRVVLTMTEDKASDVIDINPDMDPRIGEFIAQLFRRPDRTTRVPKGEVGAILKDLHESGNTVIPKIIPGEADVKIGGLGVINNYEFRGWLDEVESSMLMILKGQLNQAGGSMAEYKGHSIPIDLRLKSPKMTLSENKGNMKITIEVFGEGEIRQTYFEADEDLLNPQTVKEVEDAFCKALEEAMNKTIYKLQKELETDVLGIDNYLRQRHYKLWKDIGDDWQDVFPNIDIVPVVNIKVRRVGLVR